MSDEDRKSLPLAPLLTIIVCAAVTLVAVIIAGRTAPAFLLVMFLCWDISPFCGLAAGIFLFTRKQFTAFKYSSLLAFFASPLIGLTSVYFVLQPRPAQPAAPFLLIPALAWGLIIAAAWTGRLRT